MSASYSSLDELARELQGCQKCGLCRQRTNVVVGVGNPNAKVMFVGEAPGKNEDLQGEPFVGRSGKLLDQMLGYVGLSRKTNIYITNMAKCRPPENRDPSVDEVACCLDYLRAQTKLISPGIIVCVGRVAATALISPDYKVSKQHGTFTEKNGILMMGMYHPAALLRNPNNKPDALADLLGLREKLIELGLFSSDDLSFVPCEQ